MGGVLATYKPTFTGAAYHDTKRINLRMTSYSYSYTSSSSRSSRSSSCEEDSRSIRATSELSDKLYKSSNTDRYRFQREFYTPEPISRTGHYYPSFSDLRTCFICVFQKNLKIPYNWRYGDWVPPCILPSKALLLLQDTKQIRILQVHHCEETLALPMVLLVKYWSHNRQGTSSRCEVYIIIINIHPVYTALTCICLLTMYIYRKYIK